MAAAFAAYSVKGVSGFANTLVFSSILSFKTDNVEITPVDLLLGLPSNAYMVWRERREVSLRVAGPLILMVLAGMIPGAILLKNSDPTGLKAVMGLMISALGVEMLLRLRATSAKQTERRETGKAVLLIIGLGSGLLCGLFGIGAFLTAYISRATKSAGAFRGNLCLVFLADNLCRVLLYSLTGILSVSTVVTVLPLLPFMALGLALGVLASRHIREETAKRVVAVILILTGLSVFFTNLA
jgi:uncharacterized membrane protein YfcA